MHRSIHTTSFQTAVLLGAIGLTLSVLSAPPRPTAAQPPAPSGVSAVAVSGDRVVAIVDSQLVALRLIADERSLVEVGRAGLAPPVGSGYSLALHPDGTSAAIVDSSGVSLVAFGAGGQPIVTRVEGDLRDVGARAVAFAGRTLVTLTIGGMAFSFNDPIDVTMRVYDVTDMRAPQRIGALTWQRPVGAGATLTGFAASGRAAYIGIANSWRSTKGGHVEIVDLSEPSNPRPLPVFGVSGLLRGLAIDGDSLWVATASGSSDDRGSEGADGVQRYETADLTKPVARGWLALDVPLIDVAASQTGVWLTLGGAPPPAGQLAVVDVADPSQPRLVPNRGRDFAAEPRSLAAAGQRLAYGDAAGRVELFHLEAGRGGPGARSIAWWPDDGRPGPFATRGFPTETPTAVVTPRPTRDPATIVGRLWLPAVLQPGKSGP